MSQSYPTPTSARLRRLAIVASLAAIGSTPGCSTPSGGLASLNPFAKPDSAVVATPASVASESPATPGVGTTITNFAQGTRNQASSMGMAVKSAYGKGRDSIAGVFGAKPTTTDVETGQAIAAEDPLLLNNKPGSVGPEVFVANGQLWESTGNFDRAMDNYSKALENEPNNGPALASIARLNYRQEQYAKAVEFFQKAIVAVPNDAGLYNDLGLTLSQIGRHDEAVQAMNQAITLAPGTSRYANNLATVQFQSGREDDARATLTKHNTPAVAHYNMAYLQHSAQRNDKALQELGQVLAMSNTAGTDSASQRAVAKSKELFEKLGGPATQIAQSLPHLYGNIKQSGQAVSQLAQDTTQAVGQMKSTATGISAQFSDTIAQTGLYSNPPSNPAPSNPAPSNPAPMNNAVGNNPVAAGTQQAVTQSGQGSVNQFVTPAPPAPAVGVSEAQPSSGGFVLPLMPAPQMAEKPNPQTPPIKR